MKLSGREHLSQVEARHPKRKKRSNPSFVICEIDRITSIRNQKKVHRVHEVL